LDLISFLSVALHVVEFMPIGFLFSYLFSSPGSDMSFSFRRLATSALAGAGVAMLIESIQLVVFTRFTSVTAVMTGAIGAGIGATVHGYLALSASRRPRWMQKALALLGGTAAWRYAVVLITVGTAVVMLAPFRLASNDQRAERWQGFRRPPFAAMYVSTEFSALTNILHKGLPFFLLGVAMALSVRPPRLQSSIASTGFMLAYAALLGIGIEVAQVYVAVHQPDATDIIIYVLGAGAGISSVKYVKAYSDNLPARASEKSASCT
jgi:glycopeptide antibiotics resistance protein